METGAYNITRNNMELFDNVNRILKDDLMLTAEKGSRLSIASACFSIYAFAELKNQLEAIDVTCSPKK